MTEIILRCNCQHEFQDKTYGKGMRLHTVHQKDRHKKAAYCTVCATNRQRDKTSKTVMASDNKAFGMTYSLIYEPRLSKTY